MVSHDVTTFDKSSAAFPGIDNRVLLAACSASPLPAAALARMAEQAQLQAAGGGLAFEAYDGLLARLRASAGRLLGADAGDISFQRNSTEAISLIAAGYPFTSGDEVIGYVHEYPANHYPWRNLTQHGVRLVELTNFRPQGVADCGSRACALSLDELEQRITPRTRVVALSHVQFASGYAADVAGWQRSATSAVSTSSSTQRRASARCRSSPCRAWRRSSPRGGSGCSGRSAQA